MESVVRPCMLMPFLLYGAKIADCDVGLGPILLTDHCHLQYFGLFEKVVGTDPNEGILRSDNNLINGEMDYKCSVVIEGAPC